VGNRFSSVAGTLIVVAAVFIFGYSVGQKQGIGVEDSKEEIQYRLTGELSPEDKVQDLDFNVFWQVWDLLETKYIEKDLNEKNMLDGAIKGLVSSLGDYATAYYSDDDTSEYDRISAGNFEGIGAELGYEDGQIIIKAPLRDYPAYNAGLRAYDKILKINGESTQGLDIVEAVLKIRGERGTGVVLTILSTDEEKSRDVEIVRETIHVSSVEWEMNNGIAVVDVRRFTEDSLAQWISVWDGVMDEVSSQNPKGIILDLRGNPGGFFDAAIWAAGDFLPKGDVVSFQEDRIGRKETFKISRNGKLLDTPLVVLVDEGSASASEILSGALKHYGRAEIIGKSTYGKGTAQQVLNLDGGASLHITTQKWLLPDSSWISEENKVVPDMEVEYSREDFENGKDPQLEKALSLL